VLLSAIATTPRPRVSKARANVPKPPRGKVRTNELELTLREKVLRSRKVRARRLRKPKLVNLDMLDSANRG
jgi:hypothetical protein